MNGICKIFGILLFIGAFICAAGDTCEPHCTLKEARELCLKQMDEKDKCFVKCTFEKAGWLNASGYLSKAHLDEYSYDNRRHASFNKIHRECWYAASSRYVNRHPCEAADYFLHCIHDRISRPMVHGEQS